jgi:succinate dehydrogenase / fumarate reductase, flavoprotein subunit
VLLLPGQPRRAHSISAQGGINAAKNYQNDGDSIFRLFYDTVKGGDFRAREANVYRLAEISVDIIDQCVAQGVPFAREYGGLLDNRSFGGAQVSRTFYARGQTGQQLLLGAYQALSRQVAAGKVRLHRAPRCSTWSWSRGWRRGSSRDLRSGEDRGVDAATRWRWHGRLRNVFYLSTNAMVQRDGDLARLQARRAASRTPASRRSIPPASRWPASTSRS